MSEVLRSRYHLNYREKNEDQAKLINTSLRKVVESKDFTMIQAMASRLGGQL